MSETAKIGSTPTIRVEESLPADRLERIGRLREVLNMDDSSVAQYQRLRPLRAASVTRCPRERNGRRVVSRLEAVEVVVAVAVPSSRLDSGLENLTGLARAAS
jgi:hypothetical protein